MSDNSPDVAVGSSDMDDNEPSMEDILASIRKIIADDTPNSAEASDEILTPVVPVNNQKQDEVSVISVDTSAEHDDSEDILDLISFVDESTTPPEGALAETVSVEIPKKEDSIVQPVIVSSLEEDHIGLDETLDIVMDVNASDYVTTSLASEDAVNEKETSIEDQYTSAIEQVPSEETSLFSNASTKVQEPEILALEVPVLGELAGESLSEMLPKNTSSQENADFLAEIEPETVVLEPSRNALAQEIAAEKEKTQSIQDIIESEKIIVDSAVSSQEEVKQTSTDEDLDLVKILIGRPYG